MNPIIAAWLEYKRLADIQPSYFDKRYYPSWIGQCQRAHKWFKEVEAS